MEAVGPGGILLDPDGPMEPWIEAVRRPVLMDTTRARRKLHWMPHHDARETLRQTIAAVRSR